MAELEAPHELSLKQFRAFDVFEFWSPKLKRRVTCLGEAAYRLGVWLEFNPDVPRYSERPFGARPNGIPADFVALHQSGTSLQRVIHSYVRDRRKDAPRAKEGLDEFSTRHKAKFQWFDEREDPVLRVESDNLCVMLPYVIVHAKRGRNSIECDLLRIIENGETSLQKIEDSLDIPSVSVRGAIFSLHYRGHLHVDLSLPLTRDTCVALRT